MPGWDLIHHMGVRIGKRYFGTGTGSIQFQIHCGTDTVHQFSGLLVRADNIGHHDCRQCNIPMIQDAIERVVSNYTEEECRASFTGDIRNEMVTAVQNLFESKFIYGITLSNIKFGGWKIL